MKFSPLKTELIRLFLNQFLRGSRNKIICKLYEEETIFISAVCKTKAYITFTKNDIFIFENKVHVGEGKKCN
jgi:hypothetical protein